MNRKIIIGSRGSDLALWQANHVLNEVKVLGLSAEIKIITTQGDAIQHLSFDKMEGKGFFTKEIEEALLKKEIDLAVHSHKDLPTTAPEGLTIAAVSEREDPSDMLLIRKENVDGGLKLSIKKNAVVGTSSARRKSQLLAFRNDIEIKDLRGNVPTRIQKLRDNQYDAIMLAAAGVERLKIDLSEFHVLHLDPKEFVPAPAQGVLGLQIRESDKELYEQINKLNSNSVKDIIDIERKVLNLFDGGCQLPLGVYCVQENNTFKVWASKSDAWDAMPKRVYFEAKEKNGLAEKIVAALNGKNPLSVLITRELKETSYFKNVLAGNGCRVQGVSFIDTKKVAFKNTPVTDWIFFSSANGVRYFFEQNPVVAETTKYAVIGKATELELMSFHKQASFVGHNADTAVIGEEFVKMVGSAAVLFPQAKQSLRSIQQQFKNSKQVIDLVVYETLKKTNSSFDEAQVIVFTSPSNVEAYFDNHKISDKQKVIAIGKSTEKKLKEHGITNCILPESLGEVGLAEAVFSPS